VHGEVPNALLEVGVNDTIPVGALAVPGLVSVTVAVQVVGWLSCTVVCSQLRTVLVAR
jgi:hypothetical protein